MAFHFLAAATLTSAFTVGLTPTLVDRLREPLAQRFGWTERQAERALSLFYFTWLPCMPLAGWLIDHGANRVLFFCGQLGIILALAWVSNARTPRAFLGQLALLGIAYSLVAVYAVHLMPTALDFWNSPVAALNVGFIPVGFGALVGQQLSARLERWLGTTQSFLALGFAMMVPAALLVLAPPEQFPHLRATGELRLLGDPQLAILAVVLLIYFALENGLDVWPQPYLRELGYQADETGFPLTIFWAAFLVSRLAMAALATHQNEIWLLVLCTLICAFIHGNLVGEYSANFGTFGFWLLGACYGPLLPGFLALGLNYFPTLPATALGCMLAVSGLDTLLFRPAFALLAKRQTARNVMRVPTVLALLLALPFLYFALVR